jgi:hypothetical protein
MAIIPFEGKAIATYSGKNDPEKLHNPERPVANTASFKISLPGLLFMRKAGDGLFR